jgi:cell division protein FtsB
METGVMVLITESQSCTVFDQINHLKKFHIDGVFISLWVFVSRKVIINFENLKERILPSKKIFQFLFLFSRLQRMTLGSWIYFSLSLILSIKQTKFNNSKLKTQNSKLKTQNSKLKTQNSKLKTQNSKLKTQKLKNKK